MRSTVQRLANAIFPLVVACGPQDMALPDAASPIYGPSCPETPVARDIGLLSGVDGANSSPSAAFDGNTVIISYRENAEGSDARPMRMRIDCDGRIVRPPESILDEGLTSPQPAAVAGRPGASALIYPARRDEEWGLQVRVFDDGDEKATAFRIPVDGRASDSTIAALPAGFFVAADISAGDQSVVGAVVTDSGAPKGPLIRLSPSRTADSFKSSLTSAAIADGTNYIAWSEGGESSVDDEQVFLAEVGAGGEVELGVEVETSAVTKGPSLASSGDNLFLAYSSGVGDASDIIVRATLSNSGLVTGLIGEAGVSERDPQLALEDNTRGAIVYRGSELVVSSFAIEDGAFVASAPELVSDRGGDATIVHVRDGVYFIAWSEIETDPITIVVRGAFHAPGRD